MKNMLITTALVGFAGAAAADGHLGVTFSGDAELGYNDTINVAAGETTSGFYSELDVTVGFAAELDNGLVAAASIDLEDLAAGGGNNGVDYELSLTNDTAGLYYGDTNFAAQNVWVSAGDMEADAFSEADGEEALRGEVTFGAVSAQMSYALADSAGVRNTTDELQQLSIGASADFGNFNVVVAYQEAFNAADGPAYTAANGDITDEEIFGLSVGTSFGGADVRLAYADNATTGFDSLGVKVAYPLGPVTATAYYVAESDPTGDNWGINLAYANGPIAVTVDYQDDQGTEDWGIEGSYDVGNGIMVYAGIDDSGEDMYVAGTYDLGSGASLLVSYADDADADNSDDEVGANDYQVGTTVEISFAF